MIGTCKSNPFLSRKNSDVLKPVHLQAGYYMTEQYIVSGLHQSLRNLISRVAKQIGAECIGVSELVPGNAVIHLRVVDRVSKWDIVAVCSETLLYGNEAKSEVSLSDEFGVDLSRGATDFKCGKGELDGPVVPIKMRHRIFGESCGVWEQVGFWYASVGLERDCMSFYDRLWLRKRERIREIGVIYI